MRADHHGLSGALILVEPEKDGSGSDDSSLRPETLALDALMEATVKRVHGEPVANDAILFASNRHEAIPDSVIQDPTLEPVDKVA